ncbi:M20 metallopeptidase family protein [Amycolatopsis jejuensis]|uniref:M20 metallopeptidase family protein n=1 Tax=Amycolatopsis jejuensis TaxID=330084 RepID=UPI00052726CC|nr:M20 family metallopeptidase [Amycolatopsis jejuensis]
MVSLKGLREDAGELGLTGLRHALHREPEVGLALPRTQEKVLAALDGLPLEITTGRALTSITAVLRGASPGPSVLLRADMDALPVTERSGVAYAAEGPRMHACGHDLHTTMLVGAARLLASRRAQISGDVILMFQPGEEGFDGARHMLAEGVLDASGTRPAAAYGLHVIAAGIPNGVVTTRRGPFLAAGDIVRVTVRGAGGHGSAPHRALDPVPAACTMVTELQTMVTRGFDVFDPVVVSVGRFRAGTQYNIIPDVAEFEASIRSFSAAAHLRVKDGFLRVCRNIAAAHGLTVEIEYTEAFPVTSNDDHEAEFVAETAAELLGEERFAWAPQPRMGSEDFSCVLNEVPGAFAMLGACPPGADPAEMANNHAPEAIFDDGVLAGGAALYASLALRRLGS